MEIDRLFPGFMKVSAQPEREYYFLTQGTQVLGMLPGLKQSDNSFIVDFDFVIPAYRDFRLGHFVLGSGQELKKKFDFIQVQATANSAKHQHYLQELGFSPQTNGIWTYNN